MRYSSIYKIFCLFLFFQYISSGFCFAEDLFSKEIKSASLSKMLYRNKEFVKKFSFDYLNNDENIRICDNGILYIISDDSIYAWDSSVLNFRKFINLKQEEAGKFFEDFRASGGCFFGKEYMIISGKRFFQGKGENKVFILGEKTNFQINAQIIKLRDKFVLICEQEKCDVPPGISNDFIVRHAGEGASKVGMDFYGSWNKENIIFAWPKKLRKNLGEYSIFCLNFNEIESDHVTDLCSGIWEKYGDYLNVLESGDDIIFYDDNSVLDDPLFFLCKSLADCAPANFIKGYSSPQIYKFNGKKYFLSKSRDGDYGALFCFYGENDSGIFCKKIEGDNRFILFFERKGVGYSFQYESERCNYCLALYRWHEAKK